MSLKRITSTSLLVFSIVSCSPDGLNPKGMFEKNKRDQALTDEFKEDPVRVARQQFDVNYAQELSTARDSVDIHTIERKYDILGMVLEDEILEFDEDQKRPPEQRTYQTIGVETGTEVYKGPNFASVYHPLVLREVLRVFKDFGPLYVNVTHDEKGRPGFTRVATSKNSWSGYWYPFGDKSLYTGADAPLAKWDALMKKRGIPSDVVAKEVEKFEGFRPDHWEGLCGARALASIAVPEPTKERVIDGIRFSIADQKALYTFSHLQFPHTVYGISFRGTADTDGTYQDIKPEAFQQIVEQVLGKEKRSLVIDDTAGVQVWNKSLDAYRWKVEKDPKYEFAFLVKAFASLVKERSRGETDILTSDDDIITPSYTYRLYVDQKDMKDGKYRVIAGQWIGNSFYTHPDTVGYVHKSGDPLSHNDAFNKNISHFKSIFMNFSSSVR